MSSQLIRVRAPSNIALIKYMGKKDAPAFLGKNIPENPSLSMTLNRLSTYLEIELHSDALDRFVLDPAPPLVPSGTRTFPVSFSAQAIAKFEKHYRRVQSRMDELVPARSERPSVTVRSVNTFPAGSGIASSASSFAALTLAAFLANARDATGASELYSSAKGIRRKLAAVSREGSGSSCRSFEGPFVQWDGEEAQSCASGLADFSHFVVVVSAGEKKISSSEAHLRVKTSPLWTGRVERATERFKRTLDAIERGDRASISKLAWTETWEMHSLFHTAEEPFSYWNPQTIEGLHFFSEFLKSEKPPIVTLDAGPNIHVLVPASERAEWKDRLTAQFGPEAILEDGQGSGAEILAVT